MRKWEQQLTPEDHTAQWMGKWKQATNEELAKEIKKIQARSLRQAALLNEVANRILQNG